MKDDVCEKCGRELQDMIDSYLDCEDWNDLPPSIKITDFRDDFDPYYMASGKQWRVNLTCPKCGEVYSFSDGTL